MQKKARRIISGGLKLMEAAHEKWLGQLQLARRTTTISRGQRNGCPARPDTAIRGLNFRSQSSIFVWKTNCPDATHHRPQSVRPQPALLLRRLPDVAIHRKG